jgi:hypothetical protein
MSVLIDLCLLCRTNDTNVKKQTSLNKSAKQRRDWLTQSVRTHLLPVVIKHKFEVAPPQELPEPVDRDFLLRFPPWGRLMRRRELVVDLIQIQFASYGRAAFRINAGVVPRDGLTTTTGHRSVEEAAVDWLDEYFETHARPWLRPGLKALGLEPLGAWFSVWRWPYQTSVKEDYEKIALYAASSVPELELALRDGRLGPHVRRVTITWSRRPKS